MKTSFRHQTTSGETLSCSTKVDGSALSLEYVAGNLHRAATRGSGECGEDVTLNAKLVANIPKRLNIAADCHVRGEVVCLYRYLIKIPDVSPNPRNLCSGALRQSMAMVKLMLQTWYFAHTMLNSQENNQ